MKIAIIETGLPPEPLIMPHGDYPTMMARMLGPLAPHIDFDTIRAAAGDPMPALGAFDGLLITGSAAGVYENHAFIDPLKGLVRAAAAAGKPQVGICFGHQLMAEAFGGRVEKSEKGWGVGVHEYDVTASAPWMAPAKTRIACTVSHQDQVVAAPEGARVIAGSDFCPIGALDYAEGPAVSFQMHPEFRHDYATDLLRLRAERIAAPLVATGLQSLGGASDRALIARWIANFFNEQ